VGEDEQGAAVHARGASMIVFFFTWLFVGHGVGLVLHELGGHGLAATIVGRGFDGLHLTYFGRGGVRLTPGTHWTETRRLIVGAFRAHFGSRSRLHTLKQSTATIGVAELLYVAASRIEAAVRTDTIPSITAAAEQRAAFLRDAPWMAYRFPIRYVLFAITVAAFVLALARPMVPGDGGQDAALPSVPRRHAVGVAVAALGCALMITVLVRV
jgi:hypothetical protein